MDIKNSYNSPSFGLKVYDNTAFREVLSVAKKNRKIIELEGVLNDLLHIEGDDILIIHGYSPENAMYSSFRSGKKSVQNMTAGCKSPAEASLRAMFDLIDKDNPKLMRLLRGKVKRNISEAEIIERYTTK